MRAQASRGLTDGDRKTDEVVDEVVVAEATPDDAADVLAVIRAAFAARPVLDPPSTALEETEDSVREALARDGGLIATVGGRRAGTLLLRGEGDSLHLRRVAVLPEVQGHGAAQALAATADDAAARRGYRRVHLTARTELPWTLRFWERQGYREVGREGPSVVLAKELPVTVEAPSAEAMRSVGAALAGRLRAGDLVVLTGELGAGKTTLTQGLGDGLGVRGPVTSPTFVISRVHPSLGDGPPLVHVDAYRLGGMAELDDLDLDVSVAASVTVVEWGEGIAEGLADDRVEVRLDRAVGAGGSTDGESASDPRRVRITPVGARWVGSDLALAFA